MASNDNARGSQRPHLMLARPLLAWSLLVCLACHGSSPGGERAEDALVVVLPRAPEELDPRLTGDAYGHKISRLLFASLTRIDPNSLAAVPDLAERIEQVSPTHYRVHLRAGLRFSDGSVLDTRDVAATYRSVVDPDFGSRYASTYRHIARVEIESPTRMSFFLDGPHATFLTDLELPILRAEDEHQPVARQGGAVPVGAGPYVLSDWRPGVVSMRANPHWYGGTARFPQLRFRVVRDDNTRALRLLAGAGDLALNAVPPLLVPMFAGKDDFAIARAGGVGTTYLGFNTEAGPLSDVRVRRAIALAIDRRRIIRTKLGGRARLAKTWIPPGHWAYAEGVPGYRFDPDTARALLAQAGYADGLELTMRCGNDRFRHSMARVIVAMLSDVGIRVRLRPTEVASLIVDLNRGQFELTMLQVPEVIEPHVLSWFFGSDRIPSADREGANRWRFRSDALDRALERGRSHTAQALRKAAYREVQAILAEQLPVVSLWHEDVVAVVGQRARGFVPPRSGRFDSLAR